jgi:hypothetical protein
MEWLTEFFSWLIDSSQFMPRSHCGPGWDPHLIGYNVSANFVTFLCYMIIGTWVFFHSEGLKSITGDHSAWIWKIWGLFIFSCSLTHLQDAIIFYFPTYRLDTILRVINALCSTVALFTLPVLSRAILRGVKILTVCSHYYQTNYTTSVQNLTFVNDDPQLNTLYINSEEEKDKE